MIFSKPKGANGYLKTHKLIVITIKKKVKKVWPNITFTCRKKRGMKKRDLGRQTIFSKPKGAHGYLKMRIENRV